MLIKVIDHVTLYITPLRDHFFRISFQYWISNSDHTEIFIPIQLIIGHRHILVVLDSPELQQITDVRVYSHGRETGIIMQRIFSCTSLLNTESRFIQSN